MDFDVDIAAIGYPAVRNAFNETLQLCVEKLSKADLKLAEEILGLAALDEVSPGEVHSDAIVKRAAKVSCGRRRTATIPTIPALDDLLAELMTRRRADGVTTVLVNSFG